MPHNASHALWLFVTTLENELPMTLNPDNTTDILEREMSDQSKVTLDIRAILHKHCPKSSREVEFIRLRRVSAVSPAGLRRVSLSHLSFIPAYFPSSYSQDEFPACRLYSQEPILQIEIFLIFPQDQIFLIFGTCF